MRIEPLESRIAPAAIYTFTDVDGDKVTIKTSLGSNAELASAATVVVGQLQLLDLSASVFENTTVTITATKAGGGDGFVNVGAIKADNLDLGLVTVAGDLGQIDCGDANLSTIGLAGLNVRSMGAFGLDTQGDSPSFVSNINGPMGALVVKTDLTGVHLDISGGNIASIAIGGSLIGSSDNFAGLIQTSGNIGAVTIGKNIVGGSGDDTGKIRASGSIGNITIGGSILGGAGEYSGSIVATSAVGAVKVGGDIIGGAETYTGYLSFGSAVSLSVGGALIGGSNDYAGLIKTTGNIGPVSIGKGIIGGSAYYGGTIISGGSIGNVTITGSIVGGSGDKSGAIISTLQAGIVKITGDLVGGQGTPSGYLEFGSAASITITGSVLGAGEDSGAIVLEGNSGAIIVGGDLLGLIEGSGSIVSDTGTISSITIGGSFLGQREGSALISAAHLGAIKIGGDLVGGSGSESARIITTGRLASLTIEGSLIGGTGDNSGFVSAGSLGALKISHDLRGGTGGESGKILSAGNIDSITIAGSLVGNSGSYNSVAGQWGQISASGTIGAVKITGDIVGRAGAYSGSIVNGTGSDQAFLINSVSVGGSVIGGSGENSGFLSSAGRLGPVTIGRNLVGGSHLNSGSLSANGGDFASLTIRGSVLGSEGGNSAAIFSHGKLGAVNIGGDLVGGSDTQSGHIYSMQDIASITLGGSLLGGTDDETGYIRALGSIGAIKIRHDLVGGSIDSGGNELSGSGYIESQGRIASVTIGGSIATGVDGSSDGSLIKNATIRAGLDIGSLTVTGSILGRYSDQGSTHVIIAAAGQQTPTATTDLAIGKITVGNRVERTNFLAGYDYDLVARNADAQIGPIIVAKDWIASSAIAGAVNLGADSAPGGSGDDEDNVNYGTAADAKIAEHGESTTIASRIVSVAIGGQVFGTPSAQGSGDSYGFVAEQIGAFKVGARIYVLQPGSGNDGFNVHWRENGTGLDSSLHELGAAIVAESSAAPANSARLVNATTVTYLDTDGDKVTVKFSKPVLSPGNVNGVFTFDTGTVNDGINAWQQLQLLDLRSLATQGLGVTFTVTRGATGDGLVNVGAIDSTGYDLGAVVVPGDLGQILAGDSTLTTAGLASLSVRSLGRFDVETQKPSAGAFFPSISSYISGPLGSLTVQQDVAGANFKVTGKINTVTVNGSVIGMFEESGHITSHETIGTVKIGQHIQGSNGELSGVIEGNLTLLTVGGSILGGSYWTSGKTVGSLTGKATIAHNLLGGVGSDSGAMDIEKGGSVIIGGSIIGRGHYSGSLTASFGSGSIGDVTIGINVVGADGNASGRIVGGQVKSVTIGGSLVGGEGQGSGRIDVTGSLGTVKLGGDLLGGTGNESGYIDAEQSGAGQLGAVTIGGSVLGNTGSQTGYILSGGNLPSLKIGGNLIASSRQNTGSIYVLNNLGPVTIGGSVLDGTGTNSGLIWADGSLGAVTIAHNLSGRLQAGLSIGNVTLGGSLLGGAKSFTGTIAADESVGIVKIAGGIIGSSASSTGTIIAGAKITSVTVGDSVIGGNPGDTGSILAKNLGAVSIGRNLLGGSSETQLDRFHSGYIGATERLASLTVGGSIASGWDMSINGGLYENGSVRAGQDIGAIIVRGSLYGHSTAHGNSEVILSAGGAPVPTATSDLAIKSVSITGSVHQSLILAGYGTDVTAAQTSLAFHNPNAQIGAVTVGGHWIASSLVAGVRDVDADGFGDADDGPGGSAATISKIASITINGLVTGSTAAGDHFGFSAGSIGSFKARGIAYALAAATPLQTIELSPLTGDVTVREAFSVVV